MESKSSASRARNVVNEWSTSVRSTNLATTDTPRTRSAPLPWFTMLAGELIPTEAIRLPPLPGSEMRGLLLRGLTRIGRHRDGDPVPFTLTPAWICDPQPADRAVDVQAGEALSFHLLWFGPELDPRPVIEAGFAAVGFEQRLGWGQRRGRFVTRVRMVRSAERIHEAIDARCVALSSSAELSLRTVTPLALRSRGVMLTSVGDGRALLTSVRHRATRLSELFAAGGGPPLYSGTEPLQLIADETRPVRYRRYGRGGRYTVVEGIWGTVCLGRPEEGALRTLVVGEMLRAGRWTAFGTGHYTLAPTDKAGWRVDDADVAIVWTGSTSPR